MIMSSSFAALLVLCVGNPPVTDGFPLQRPVTWSFDVFFDLRFNKRLSKQSRRRWFETPLISFWRQCNDEIFILSMEEKNDYGAWIASTNHQITKDRLLDVDPPRKYLIHV